MTYQTHSPARVRAAGSTSLPPSVASEGLAPRAVNEVIDSPGHPLDASTRDFFSQTLGHDFSRVRVHTDHAAADSARAVNAHAYTVGQDVVFGAGQYSPESEFGRYLLAHELAHTMQQGSRDLGSSARQLPINSPGDAYEREADAVAASALHRAARGPASSLAPQPTLSAGSPFVARVDCSTVSQSLCKGIYSCGHGGSGRCYWGGTYPNKRCMCFGASRPDVSTSKVLEALLIIGLSLALVVTVVAALLDPEPVSKLGLAGLTAAEMVALLLLLGYSRDEVREMGLDPDLVAQVDLGEGSQGEEGATRVA